MTHKITDDCIACGACVSECPVESITEGTGKYVIDSATCTDCTNCISVCPVAAIVKE